MDIYYFWLPVLFAWSNLTSQKSEASCLSQWQVILYNFLFEGKRVVCASLIAVTRLSAKILFFGFFFNFNAIFAAAYVGARKTRLREGMSRSENQQMSTSFSALVGRK